MRICAISLPELRIELVGTADPQDPRDVSDVSDVSDVTDPAAPDKTTQLAVVVAPPPMTEAKLLGNTRLSVVSKEARALGVMPGQTIAQARARAGQLTVRVVRPNAVEDVLARIAEIGLAFGATVSYSAAGGSAASDHGDIVWVDVTGCAHLHARARQESASIFDGETLLASRLAGVITSLGYTCTVAIADGPRIAAMLARASALHAGRAAGHRGRGGRGGRGAAMRDMLDTDPVVVPPGENAAAIAGLPVAMLPLPPEDVRWLTKIGVRTIQDLRALPREGLGDRLGARSREVLALAFGEDRAPLHPYVPPEVPEEQTELEYGVEGAQALTFVAKTLTDRLASRLRGRGVAASRLELELRLDAAMLERPDPHTPHVPRTPHEMVELDLPAPLVTPGDLLAALRPKIERLALPAPVLSAKLRAPGVVRQRAFELSLFDPRPRAERALPRLVAELVSDLGPEAVSTLVLGDSWIPEERSRLVAFRADAPSTTSKKQRQLVSSVPEPTRLLAEPRPLAKESVRITRHLGRLESVGWWHETPASSVSSTLSARRKRCPVDYVQAWTEDGSALVELNRAGGGIALRGWFD